MKKIKIIACVFLSFALIFPVFSYALENDTITESPAIKVMVDGDSKTFDDVPLVLNGRLMLPLRSLIINLGVPNDDEHISWNSDERKVTISTESAKIILNVGSSTAYVNGDPIIIDSKAILYSGNGRVYIPARFVGESLGYEVAWDKYTKCVYFRNSADYKTTKENLEKSLSKMSSFKRYITKVYGDPENITAYNVYEIDKEKRIAHNYTVFNEESEYFSIKKDIYQIDGAIYSKLGILYDKNAELNWLKTTDSNSKYDSDLHSIDPDELLNPRDVLYAGLNYREDLENNRILLYGDVYPVMKFVEEKGGYYDRSSLTHISGFVGIVIDKRDFSILGISVKSITTEDENEIQSLQTCEYSDFDGDFNIIIPKEALNATE